MYNTMKGYYINLDKRADRNNHMQNITKQKAW